MPKDRSIGYSVNSSIEDATRIAVRSALMMVSFPEYAQRPSVHYLYDIFPECDVGDPIGEIMETLE